MEAVPLGVGARIRDRRGRHLQLRRPGEHAL
jgi:hypothetical protein